MLAPRGEMSSREARCNICSQDSLCEEEQHFVNMFQPGHMRLPLCAAQKKSLKSYRMFQRSDMQTDKLQHGTYSDLSSDLHLLSKERLLM